MDKIIFDYSKLRGRIVEKCGTIQNFCGKSHISSTSLYEKLIGKTYFNQKEILKAAQVLDITDYVEYFFCLSMSVNRNEEPGYEVSNVSQRSL